MRVSELLGKMVRQLTDLKDAHRQGVFEYRIVTQRIWRVLELPNSLIDLIAVLNNPLKD
jgi:hypothetical protein